MDSNITQLSESLIDEMVRAVGLPTTKFTHALFWRLFRRITNRLANLGAPFDQKVGDEGLPAASAWALTHFCNPSQARDMEHIPSDGPLLVVSNHPGAYDGLVLFSHISRQDIHWVSSEIQFFDLLTNTRKQILFASRKDSSNRMLVLRNAIRHLRQGGTLVYFAAGHRDPDPAVFHGAAEAMDGWLDVFDVFFKYVQELRILPAVVSGVVTQYWAHHPITWLRRKQIDRHRLAEFGQVINQLLHPGKLMVTPTVTFGTPFTENDLRQEVGNGRLLPAVIARGKSLLREHCSEFGGWGE
ncbi:MAG: 1-acyl-sn-glycerol-3-phosphate acyltransferase [Chloroflexota bacterium]